MAGAMEVGTTTHKPTARYRVLATYWEAEESVECWTETSGQAVLIASVLMADTTHGDVSVQVDKVQ